jgi:hypothetical protein
MRSLVNTVVTQSPAMLPALHQTLDELGCRGRSGITIMREVLAEHPIGSKVVASGLEARVLQIARNAGILDLECQVDVGGHSWLGRVDFAILRLRLLIEVDSVIHHSSPADTARDEARDEAMLAAGLGQGSAHPRGGRVAAPLARRPAASQRDRGARGTSRDRNRPLMVVSGPENRWAGGFRGR